MFFMLLWVKCAVMFTSARCLLQIATHYISKHVSFLFE